MHACVYNSSVFVLVSMLHIHVLQISVPSFCTSKEFVLLQLAVVIAEVILRALE